MRRRIAGVLGLAVLLLAAGVAQAQKFPARAIQFVVPLAAGSTTDVAARMIAQRVAQTLDAQIIVENRPGSSTMLGSAMVAKAEPDGHTLLMGASSLAVNQNLFKTVPYDTEKPERRFTSPPRCSDSRPAWTCGRWSIAAARRR